MTPDSFRRSFPCICTILQGSVLEDDISAAIAFAEEGDECLRGGLEARVFELNELMWLLAGAIVPTFNHPDGLALEKNLSAVIAEVGVDVARRTYREKLLVDESKTLEDTQYEIAVTSKACAVLDPGSVQMEKPIPDSRKQQRHWKNTDVFGTFQGQPVRIEVTVMHESLPGVVHLELDDMVKAAATPLGFSLALRTLLLDEGYAERVRAMLELLAEAHTGSGGKDEEIDGVKFRWNKGAYHCDQDTSPFKSIVFYDLDEFPGAASLREITHPCSVRAITSRFILEDHPNPPGVITSADLPDAPTQVPVSTKVHQMLAGKLQQCEEGVVNIIAFGNPHRMHDREISNAVLGVEVVTVPFTEERSGLRQFGNAMLTRNPKAPFVPTQYLANSDDCREFVDPFRKMSAVWHVRIGYDALSTCIPNPNAAVPAPDDLLPALADPPIVVQAVSESKNDADDSNTEGLPEEIIWPEMAQDFIAVCGSLREANVVLEKLQSSGRSLEELQSLMDQFWSGDSETKNPIRFISPSNEQMGMQFVIDCGGYEQAKACLAEVAVMLEEWWRTGFYHEAGHAVASLVRWRRSGAITAQNPTDGVRKPSFAFDYNIFVDLRASAQNLLIVFAAGAQAEKIVLGKQESEGFVGDFANIQRCMAIDANCRPHYQQQIDSDYPETKELIRQYAGAVRLIGETGFTRFVADHPNGIDESFSKTVVLTSEEVQSLFDEYKAVYRQKWIAENAYMRWCAESRPDGQDVRHWLEAENEYSELHG